MNNITIFCVTYNSYDSLTTYLQSISQAAELCADEWRVRVCVADNTCDSPQHIAQNFPGLELKVYPFHQNIGYMGALQRMYNNEELSHENYVALSNVDLTLPTDFFQTLGQTDLPQTTGWLAPSILSGQEHKDRNPKVLRRYSRRKLEILRTLFRFPLLYNLYCLTLYRRKKLLHNPEPRAIYAGHGSFMLLTSRFVEKVRELNYPVFLFCEEIYIAELCREHQLTVDYRPTVRVLDEDHVSTGMMRRSSYCRYNYEALTHILATYYS